MCVQGPGSSLEPRTHPHHVTSQTARSLTQLLRRPSPKCNTFTADLRTPPPGSLHSVSNAAVCPVQETESHACDVSPCHHIPNSSPTPKAVTQQLSVGTSGTRDCSAVTRASASVGVTSPHDDFRPPPPRPSSVSVTSA